jgi:hypothetical protein
MKNSSESVMLATVLNSHATAAMETTAGNVTANPVRKQERQRAKKDFFTPAV